MERADFATSPPRLDARTVALYLLMGLALAFVLRAQSFFIGPGYDPDEGVCLLQGRALLEGGWLPFTLYFDHRQPLLYANFALAQWLLGEELRSVRLWAAMNVGFAAGFLALLIRRVGGSPLAAFAAAALLAFFSTSTSGLVGVSEIFLLPWTTLAVLLAAIAATQHGGRVRRYAVFACAGLALGIAVQVKLLAGAESLGVAAAACLLGARVPLRETIARLACIAGFALLPTLAVMAIYAAAGQWPIYVYATFTYNRAYAAQATFDPSLAWQFALGTAIRFSALWIPFLLALAAVGLRQRKIALLLLWFIGCVVSVTATKRFFPHYSLTLLPPLCALAACAPVRELMNRRPLLRIVVPLALVAGCISPLSYLIFRQGEFGRVQLEADSITHLIERYSEPGDEIYLANNDPDFYFTTKTRPATYWIFPQWVGSREWIAVSQIDWKMELQRIVDRRPKVIVIRGDGKGVWGRDVWGYLRACAGGADYYRAAWDGPFDAFIQREPTSKPATRSSRRGR